MTLGSTVPSPSAKPSVHGRWVWAIGALVVFYVLAQTAFGPKIDANRGLGFDGKLYGKYALDFWQVVATEGIPSDKIQRMLPSALAFHLMQAAGLTPSEAHVIQTFKWMNAALLLGAVFCAFRALVVLGLSAPVVGFGLLAMFWNYGSANFLLYYPVLTDQLGLFLASASLLAFVKGSKWSLVILGVVGTFCWPTALITNTILLLLPFPGEESTAPLDETLNQVAAVILTGGLLFGMFYFREAVLSVASTKLAAKSAVWLFAVLITLTYVYALTRGLARVAILPLFRRVIKDKTWLPALILVVIALGLKRWVLFAAGREAVGPENVGEIFIYFSTRAVLRPGNHLLDHAIWLGPVVLVLLVCWKKINAQTFRQSVGLWAVTALYVYFSLDCETRHLFYGVPFVVAAACLGISSLNLNRSTWWALAAISTFTTKLWLPYPVLSGDLSSAEAHRYWMNTSLGMTHFHYVLQLGIGLALWWWTARALGKPVAGKPSPVAELGVTAPGIQRQGGH